MIIYLVGLLWCWTRLFRFFFSSGLVLAKHKLSITTPKAMQSICNVLSSCLKCWNRCYTFFFVINFLCTKSSKLIFVLYRFSLKNLVDIKSDVCLIFKSHILNGRIVQLTFKKLTLCEQLKAKTKNDIYQSVFRNQFNFFPTSNLNFALNFGRSSLWENIQGKTIGQRCRICNHGLSTLREYSFVSLFVCVFVCVCYRFLNRIYVVVQAHVHSIE